MRGCERATVVRPPYAAAIAADVPIVTLDLARGERDRYVAADSKFEKLVGTPGGGAETPADWPRQLRVDAGAERDPIARGVSLTVVRCGQE